MTLYIRSEGTAEFGAEEMRGKKATAGFIKSPAYCDDDDELNTSHIPAAHAMPVASACPDQIPKENPKAIASRGGFSGRWRVLAKGHGAGGFVV